MSVTSAMKRPRTHGRPLANPGKEYVIYLAEQAREGRPRLWRAVQRTTQLFAPRGALSS